MCVAVCVAVRVAVSFSVSVTVCVVKIGAERWNNAVESIERKEMFLECSVYIFKSTEYL